MTFELTETQKNIVEAAKKISSKFDDNYWLDLDLKSKFPLNDTGGAAFGFILA